MVDVIVDVVVHSKVALIESSGNSDRELQNVIVPAELVAEGVCVLEVGKDVVDKVEFTNCEVGFNIQANKSIG